MIALRQVLQTNRSIGMFLSGGFDSTTLAYLVFTILAEDTTPSTDITIYTVPRYDDSAVHVDRVMAFLHKEFPSIMYNTKLVGDAEVHHSKQVLSGVEEALALADDVLLLGVTKNPDVYIGRGEPVRTATTFKRIIKPFISHDKSTVITLANELGVLDDISKVSHSCTQSKAVRCNTCWQCLERKWAFDKLGLKDIGTM